MSDKQKAIQRLSYNDSPLREPHAVNKVIISRNSEADLVYSNDGVSPNELMIIEYMREVHVSIKWLDLQHKPIRSVVYPIHVVRRIEVEE